MRILTSTLCLLSALVFAQEPAAATPADAPAEQPANALQPDEKLGLLQGKIEALEEQFMETSAVVRALNKIKISGYIQARYQYAENSLDGLDAAGSPLVKDGFTVRRGRLKTEYQGTVARYMLQIDATPTGVVLKDAEASLTEPWSGKGVLSVIAGVTKWPFGYEVVQSSGEREFPERTRMIRAFFNGERDRGVKLQFKYGPWRANLGVFDGNGQQNKAFIGVDNDREKDVYGRFNVDFKWISAGISGSWGETYRPDTVTVPGKHFTRNRIGLDAQVYLDLFPFGSTAIKGEFVAGTTYQAGNVEVFGKTALGWYLLLVQNIGSHEQVAFRYDFFDPATGTPNAPDANNIAKTNSLNQVQTFGVLFSHYFDETLKASLIYEIPLVLTSGTTDSAPHQNLLTLQLQAKF